MNRQLSFYIASLGCPKNLVDSEGIALLLSEAGYEPVMTPEESDVIIVNTCGFIASAREEALEVLEDLAADKRADQLLIAAGCYSQRCPQELATEIPGIDGIIGTRRWMDIVPLLEQIRSTQREPPEDPICHLPDVPTVGQDAPEVPRATLQGASAYLKIADGCRRTCAFCAIPLIKGTYVSRPPHEILRDARILADYGARELIVIAQDTTDYGHDLGLEDGLSALLDELLKEVPEVPWLRVMYAYPARITDRLIDTMAQSPRVLPYLDLPLQHAHPDVLRRMQRPANIDSVRHTIEQLRAAMPDLALRTTLLVGFPGETEEEFKTLLRFVDEMAFDRVGVFTYSHERGTPAATREDDVPEAVKEERRERVLAVQQPISLAKNEAQIGRTLDVLIEGVSEGLSVGRSYRDAPEIDGLVLIEDTLPVGKIVPVEIVSALEYDLVGVPAEGN